MNLLSLPIENIFHFLQFIEINELAKLQIISKNFQEIISTYFTFFKKLPFSLKGISTNNLNKLLYSFPKLNNLVLDCINISDNEFAILSQLKDLQQLTLINIKNKIKFGFYFLHQIQKITITNCDNLKYEYISCDIELLTITNCKIFSKSIKTLEKSRIKKIIIRDCVFYDYENQENKYSHIIFINCKYIDTKNSYTKNDGLRCGEMERDLTLFSSLVKKN